MKYVFYILNFHPVNGRYGFSNIYEFVQEVLA